MNLNSTTISGNFLSTLPSACKIILNTVSRTYEFTCTKEECLLLSKRTDLLAKSLFLTLAAVFGLIWVGIKSTEQYSKHCILSPSHANFQNQSQIKKYIYDHANDKNNNCIKKGFICLTVTCIAIAYLSNFVELFFTDNRCDII